jgi:hypothetical protein
MHFILSLPAEDLCLNFEQLKQWDAGIEQIEAKVQEAKADARFYIRAKEPNSS